MKFSPITSNKKHLQNQSLDATVEQYDADTDEKINLNS